MPRDRVRVKEGSLYLDNLHQTDYGEYECVASNEVATLLTSTKVIVEGTRPHAPFNITASSAVFTVTLNWLPGYSGGPDFRQNYVVWYVHAERTRCDNGGGMPYFTTFMSLPPKQVPTLG